jgi:hypothetical protein
MPGMHSKYVNGNLVFYEEGKEYRWIDAIGPTVRKYYEDFCGPVPTGADNADPLGWDIAVLAGDAGSATFTAGNEAGGALVLTTDDTEDDGINAKHNNEAWVLANDDPLYFGIRLKVSDADATDLMVGLCIDDAEMWGGITEGVYFESADATAVCTFVTESASTETSDTSAGTLTEAYHVLEFYWDGATYVHAYFDGTLVASSSTNIPQVEPLKFAIEFLTGETGVNTCTIDWIRIIQCQ